MHISNESGTKILSACHNSIVHILNTIGTDTVYIAINSCTSMAVPIVAILGGIKTLNL